LLRYSSKGNDITALLEKDIPLVKSHKCLCHQQNTALKRTYKNFKMLQSFNKDLCEVINYINWSPKKIKIPEDKEKELEFNNNYQLLKAKEIR